MTGRLQQVIFQADVVVMRWSILRLLEDGGEKLITLDRSLTSHVDLYLPARTLEPGQYRFNLNITIEKTIHSFGLNRTITIERTPLLPVIRGGNKNELFCPKASFS